MMVAVGRQRAGPTATPGGGRTMPHTVAAEARALSAVPMWRPVRGGNAFEITVARLAQAIRLGLVPVGERLPPERELAERLQVSRGTPPESSAAVRGGGFLESRRGRSGGTFVVRATGEPGGSGAGQVQDATALAREMG